MAQVALTKTGGKLGQTDLTSALAAATSPAAFANDGQTFLQIVVGATPTTLNMTPPTCSHGRAYTNPLTLGANKTWLVGPFPQAEFNDSSGNANFTLSSLTSVTVAAVQLNNG